MTLEIISEQTTRHDFGAIVTGLNVIDASVDDNKAVKAAMDRYVVLIFPYQQLTDEQQFAFSSSRKFGAMENATGDINQNDDRRLPLEINDISNLDREGSVLARSDLARLFGLGSIATRCRRMQNSSYGADTTMPRFHRAPHRIVDQGKEGWLCGFHYLPSDLQDGFLIHFLPTVLVN